MGTYKGIQGYSVQSLASDPTAENTIGQLFYNSASNVWKISSDIGGAWSSGGTLNDGRMNAGYGGAANTAAIFFGGSDASLPAPTKYFNNTESYNGTAWTEVNTLTQASNGCCGAGSSTAAIETGGDAGGAPYFAETEAWDGTCWTGGNDCNTGRTTFGMGGAATSSAMIFGGINPLGTPPTANFYIRTTETYDGTSWTEVNQLNVGREQIAAATQGSATAMLCIGGEVDIPARPPAEYPGVESWNGTCWAEGNNLTNGRTNGGGAGIQTLALRFGGSPTPADGMKTESWNGTSWTEVNDLGTPRTSAGGGNGVATSAIYAGGKNAPTDTGLTISEEWTDPSYGNQTVTTS